MRIAKITRRKEKEKEAKRKAHEERRKAASAAHEVPQMNQAGTSASSARTVASRKSASAAPIASTSRRPSVPTATNSPVKSTKSSTSAKRQRVSSHSTSFKNLPQGEPSSGYESSSDSEAESDFDKLSDHPAPLPKKRTKVPFDKEDEKALVKQLIAQRRNSDRIPKSMVYKRLAETHPDHTKDSWQSFHRDHRDEIDARVEAYMSRKHKIISAPSTSSPPRKSKNDTKGKGKGRQQFADPESDPPPRKKGRVRESSSSGSDADATNPVAKKPRNSHNKASRNEEEDEEANVEIVEADDSAKGKEKEVERSRLSKSASKASKSDEVMTESEPDLVVSSKSSRSKGKEVERAPEPPSESSSKSKPPSNKNFESVNSDSDNAPDPRSRVIKPLPKKARADPVAQKRNSPSPTSRQKYTTDDDALMIRFAAAAAAIGKGTETIWLPLAIQHEQHSAEDWKARWLTDIGGFYAKMANVMSETLADASRKSGEANAEDVGWLAKDPPAKDAAVAEGNKEVDQLGGDSFVFSRPFGYTDHSTNFKQTHSGNVVLVPPTQSSTTDLPTKPTPPTPNPTPPQSRSLETQIVQPASETIHETLTREASARSPRTERDRSLPSPFLKNIPLPPPPRVFEHAPLRKKSNETVLSQDDDQRMEDQLLLSIAKQEEASDGRAPTTDEEPDINEDNEEDFVWRLSRSEMRFRDQHYETVEDRRKFVQRQAKEEVEEERRRIEEEKMARREEKEKAERAVKEEEERKQRVERERKASEEKKRQDAERKRRHELDEVERAKVLEQGQRKAEAVRKVQELEREEREQRERAVAEAAEKRSRRQAAMAKALEVEAERTAQREQAIQAQEEAQAMQAQKEAQARVAGKMLNGVDLPRGKRPRASDTVIARASSAGQSSARQSSVERSATANQTPATAMEKEVLPLVASASANSNGSLVPKSLGNTLQLFADRYSIKRRKAIDLYYVANCTNDLQDFDDVVKWYIVARHDPAYAERDELKERVERLVWSYEDDLALFRGDREELKDLKRRKHHSCGQRRRCLMGFNVDSLETVQKRFPFKSCS
ncbi:hypothetical protein P7C70_g4244, partial [Phenoliferia sp. Uapishka_3]